jgi:arginine/ornithine transport system substrate-binding protein
MIRRLAHSIFLLAAASLSALQGGVTAQTKKLRIGVEASYPPFSELDANGKLKGFDIDIANATCAHMKRECELVQLPFDGLIPALNVRKIDAIVASMSITEERKKMVDFSDKYYQTPARFVLKAGPNTNAKTDVSPVAMKGKRIGVQSATIHDRFLTDLYAGATLVRYGKQEEAYLDLVSGRIDAAFADSIATDLGFLKTPSGKPFAFAGPDFSEPRKYFGDGAGIAVRKGDNALREGFNAGIAAIRADGRYKAIQSKYFAFDIYGAAPAAPAGVKK